MSERLKKVGATLSAAIALGGISVKSIEAYPSSKGSSSTPVNIENKPPYYGVGPKGVEALSSVEEIEKEIAEAKRSLHRAWNGVLVLKAPTRNAGVAFNQSPRAYGHPASYHFAADLSFQKGTNGFVEIVRPGIEKFKGRVYAVVYSDDLRSGDGEWAFLDITWAKQNGALLTYAFKDSPPRPMEWKDEGPDTYPIIYAMPTNAKPDKYNMAAVYLPQNAEMKDKKRYFLQPSSVVPHP